MIGRELFNEQYPEFHLNNHSPDITNSKLGWLYFWMKVATTIMPVLLFFTWLNYKSGYYLIPVLRPVPDHA